MAMEISLCVRHDVVPYVRMTQRGKWSSLRAQEYLASQMRLAMLLKSEMARLGLRPAPPRTRLRVQVTMFEPGSVRHNRDLDNLVKAVLDAARGVVIPDDRWVDEIAAVRTISDDDAPRVALIVETLTE